MLLKHSEITGQARLEANSSNSPTADGFIVRSAPMKGVLQLVQQVSRHPAAVLIVGETGTGKEMIARAIHASSLRCNHPWVDLNCAAIPEHLVESELFGYEKGAFSGADSMKLGLFELANKGTLFLDEIGDLDLKVQVKLLRVLDGVPYYRLGGSRKVTVDVRVVAATNQNLEELVAAGRFRRDLYHRLAQFKLEIPPLRERTEDLLAIAEHVLRQHNAESHFTQEAITAMVSYRWPGNVRELKNTVFHAVMCAEDSQAQVTAADLGLPEIVSSNGHPPLNGDLNQVERQMILQALKKFEGNQGKAAESLGISRRTLLRKLKIYREIGPEANGDASGSEQDRHYRAPMRLPLSIKHEGEQLEAVMLNLSLGGAAITTGKKLKIGASVSIFLAMETCKETELAGRIAWSSSAGHHGIEFTNLQAGVRSSLRYFLLNRMPARQQSTAERPVEF